jgi:hypothetical protein
MYLISYSDPNLGEIVYEECADEDALGTRLADLLTERRLNIKIYQRILAK